MADLVRPDPQTYGCRIFNGPDGATYRWRPSPNSSDILVSLEWPPPPFTFSDPSFPLQLQDASGNVIAFFRPTRQTRYQLGDVFGELHFIRSAGSGTVVSKLCSINISI